MSWMATKKGRGRSVRVRIRVQCPPSTDCTAFKYDLVRWGQHWYGLGLGHWDGGTMGPVGKG